MLILIVDWIIKFYKTEIELFFIIFVRLELNPYNLILEEQLIKRYTEFALPGYRYIPNQMIHPSKNHGVEHLPQLPTEDIILNEQNWHQSLAYLYAIDLFNYHYYWEVHEVLEKIWLKVGKFSKEGIFIQGIIQLSIALLKEIEGNLNGVIRLSKKALPKLKSRYPLYLGIDIEELVITFELFIQTKEQKQPQIILKF